MGILGWFDTKDVESYANGIADRLAALSDRSGEVLGNSPKKVRKVLEGFDAVLLDVTNYRKSHPLNVFKKAKFLNVVKWGLQEHGCSSEFVNKAISALTVSLNQ